MPNIFRKQEFVIGISGLLLFCLILVAGFYRPLFPVNETLYTGVAWDMWAQHHILTPIMDGHLYNQKPPLFFWLMDIGWSIFGVNNWWPRVLPALCAIGTLALTVKTAKTLFKENDNIGLLALFIVLGCAYWTYYLPRARIDQLLCLCVMISLYGAARVTQQNTKGWILFTIGNALGLLTKGPITFVFTLPIIALIPVFTTLEAKNTYRHLCYSLLGAIAMVAIWAIPLIIAHPEYAKSILWDQTSSRLTHQGTIHPWYYYAIRLPLLLAPWIAFPFVWQSALRLAPAKIEKLLRYSLLISLGILCCIGPKASRFLLPWLPIFGIWLAHQLSETPYRHLAHQNDIIAFALIFVGIGVLCTPGVAYLITPKAVWIPAFVPWWGFGFILLGFAWCFNPKTLTSAVIGVGASVVICTILFYATVIHAISPLYDLERISTKIAQLQTEGHPIAYVGHYDDRFQFIGKLRKPITALGNTKVTAWATNNPSGYIITVNNKNDPIEGEPLLQQRYRSQKRLILWPASHFTQRATS